MNRLFSGNKFNIDKTFYFISFCLSVLLVIIMFSSLDEANIYEFLNSDCLFFPNLYKDLILDGSPLMGWSLGTTPNYFPSGMSYFFLAFLTQNLLVAHFINGILHYIVVLLLMFCLIKQTIKQYYFAGSIVNLVFAFFPIHTIIAKDFIFSSYLFLPYHIGAFIITIINLIFIIKYLKSSKQTYLRWYSVFTFLIVFSNQIYLISSISFIFSFILTKRIVQKDKIKIILLTVLSSVFGFFLLYLIKLTNYFTYSDSIVFHYDRVLLDTTLLINQFVLILLSYDFRSLIFCLSLITFFTLILIYFFKNKVVQTNVISNFLLIFVGFYSLGTFFAPGISTMYIDISCLRYYISAFYMLLGALSLMVSIHFISNKFKILIVFTTIFPIFILIFSTSNIKNIPKGINNIIKFYPHTVRIVDSIADIKGFKYGLAGYWDATHIRLLSRNNLRIYSVDENFKASFHNSNKNWYLPNNITHYNNPKFTFILDGCGLDKEHIESFLPFKPEIIKIGEQNIFLTPGMIFDAELFRPFFETDSISNILCNMENISDDNQYILSTDIHTKFINNKVVEGNCFSGKNSYYFSAVSNYCLEFKIDSVKEFTIYDVSILVKNYSKNITIDACIKSPSDFYVTNDYVEDVNRDWKKLRLVFNVPRHLLNEKMSINIYKPNDTEVYLDDLTIKIKRIKKIENFLN